MTSHRHPSVAVSVDDVCCVPSGLADVALSFMPAVVDGGLRTGARRSVCTQRLRTRGGGAVACPPAQVRGGSGHGRSAGGGARAAAGIRHDGAGAYPAGGVAAMEIRDRPGGGVGNSSEPTGRPSRGSLSAGSLLGAPTCRNDNGSPGSAIVRVKNLDSHRFDTHRRRCHDGHDARGGRQCDRVPAGDHFDGGRYQRVTAACDARRHCLRPAVASSAPDASRENRRCLSCDWMYAGVVSDRNGAVVIALSSGAFMGWQKARRAFEQRSCR